jgi:hypothetical protein
MASVASAVSARGDRVRVRYAGAWSAVVAGGFAFAVTGALAAESGGYFSRTWGLPAVMFFWIAAGALVMRDRIQVSRLEQATAVALIGLLGWTALSSFWGDSAAPALREVSRSTIYVGGVLAALLLVRSAAYRSLIQGTWAAVSIVGAYSLATRLFPERLADPADLLAYRLDEPIGYWNALGAFVALGILLALGIAARGRGLLLRAGAAASTVFLLPVLYFTFSRGAWVALAAGFLAMLAVDRRRLHLLAVVGAVGVFPALAVLSASTHDALTRPNPALDAARAAGQELAGVILVLALAAAIVVVIIAVLEPRVRVGRDTRIAIWSALGGLAVAALVTVWATQGSPRAIAERAYDQLEKPVATSNSSLQGRLFNLSSPGRIAHWQIAWNRYKEKPLLGVGGGAYERYWLRDRAAAGPVRDAHSLYLEMLTELGPVGLALLGVALGLPLVAGVRARHRALVPAAFGAYAAYLAHAAIDWDWEMPAVTMPALLCGCAMLVAARGPSTRSLSVRLRAGVAVLALILAGFSLTTLIGYQALEASRAADLDDNPQRAEREARKAVRWLPWSTEARQVLAESYFDQNDRTQARAVLLEAVERDRGDWAIWYNLGVASDGRARLVAYREAARLNPYSANVSVLRTLGVLPPLLRTTKNGSPPAAK